MNKIDDYEKTIKERQEINDIYLDKFEEWLVNKKLSDKTIKNHISNATLYINDFLTYYDDCAMEKGCSSINNFLGDWFIRKCMWSTASSIKSTASSIKKFYQCMLELNFVSKEDYEFLCREIKDNMNNWTEEVNRYNSDDYDCEYYF